MNRDRDGEGMRNRMRGMMQQMMSDMLPPGIDSEELPDRNSPGAKLLIRYCTDCHNLPSPAMHSAEEWPVVSGRMFRRMERMGGMMGGRMGGMGRMGSNTPSQEEQEVIVDYLKEHALAAVSGEQFASQNSEGALLFKETCTQCHALPDPNLHNAQEWERVIERMQGHMETMNKSVITDLEKQEIVDFLEKQAS